MLNIKVRDALILGYPVTKEYLATQSIQIKSLQVITSGSEAGAVTERFNFPLPDNANFYLGTTCSSLDEEEVIFTLQVNSDDAIKDSSSAFFSIQKTTPANRKDDYKESTRKLTGKDVITLIVTSVEQVSITFHIYFVGTRKNFPTLK